ncbi:MAG: M14 family metallopeptidase [Alphaproteobacteria bacterium]|nr:M14 family metallopeptidase [Alphaproteobacteria bacterium]
MTMADMAQLFSDDLPTARARFLKACDRIGLRVASFPGRGPAPEGAAGALYCDAARLGSPEADRMLVICSAASGGAGFAGAGVAHGVLAAGLMRELPRTVSCLLIHAVNPLGAVWPPASEDPAGETTDPASSPAAPLKAEWSDGLLSAAEQRFSAYERAQRFDREALAGRTLASVAPPAWDAGVQRAIADAHFPGKRRLLFLDVRTGPGPFGEIERMAPAGPGLGRPEAAQRWTGLALAGGREGVGETRVRASGGLAAFARDPALEKACVVLEVGAYSIATLLQAGGPTKGGAVAAYPRDVIWREQLWDAASDLIRRGFEGLAG